MNVKLNHSKISKLFGALTMLLVFNGNISKDNNFVLFSTAFASIIEPLEELPDFSKYVDVKEKKKAFFNTLYPIIQYENKEIITLRVKILKLKKVPFDSLSADEKAWLSEVADLYRIDHTEIDDNLMTELVNRVDYVPPSLALTQAAIESGWGTSRFSKQGNNIFGQWCFEKGCGIVPSSREAGKDHEVAKFETINEAVRAYLHNLNSNSAFSPFRDLRTEIRATGQLLTGTGLAKSLLNYSAGAEKYVKKLTSFINQNKLQTYTKSFEQSLPPAQAKALKQ